MSAGITSIDFERRHFPMAEHAFLAPSDYEGWANCPGKPALAEHYPDASSPDADWGTLAHEYATRWLRAGAPPGEGIPDPAMYAAVECVVLAALDNEASCRRAGGEVRTFLNRRVPVGLITGEAGAEGTLDYALVVCFPDGRCVLEVTDWKFGVGVPVPAEDNGQLQMYALAFMLEHSAFWTFTQVELAIHQPRLRSAPARWSTTAEQLYVFGAQATEKAAVALGLRGSAEALEHLVPGVKQCRFCRAKAQCPALARFATTTALGEIKNLNGADSVQMLEQGKSLALTPQELAQHYAENLPKVELILTWCKAIKEGAYRLAVVEGVPIPGLKVVDGQQGDRKFPEPDIVTLLARGLGYTDAQLMTQPVLLTPPAMEKALPPKKHAKLWDLLKGDPEATPPRAGLISRSPGVPVLVPLADPRAPRAAQAPVAQVLSEISNLENPPS
jgi:Protein of unknown function (DUF2800)